MHMLLSLCCGSGGCVLSYARNSFSNQCMAQEQETKKLTAQQQYESRNCAIPRRSVRPSSAPA